MYYIPSLEKEVIFKPLTIGQFNELVNAHNSYPVAHLGFNLTFIQTIQENCLEEIALTDFDKHAIFIQTCLNDFELPGFFNKEFKQPKPYTLSNYDIELNIPTVSLEKEYCSFLMQQTTNFSDIFLLTEIAKYIQKNNNTNINWETTIDKKIKNLQFLSIEILTDIIKYIDSYKAVVNNYYKEALGEDIKFALNSLVV